MQIDELIKEIKEFTIDILDLEDVSAEDLSDNQPLLEQDVDLNSIELLELSVALEKKYQIKIGNAETAKQVFQNFQTIAEYIINLKK